jgi:uncharacterized membrane protein YphA (DoxX/SURF4 family)
MSRLGRFISIAVIGLGIAGLVLGVAFVVEGQSKANFIKQSMRDEQITLGLSDDAIARGDVVDTAAEAQKAADTIKGHRTSKYGTYSEVTGGKGFDPADTNQIKYMQALNLENSLYLAVASLGLTTVTIVSGAFMIVTGLALTLTGFVLGRLPKKVPATA